MYFRIWTNPKKWFYLGCKRTGVFGTGCDIMCPAACTDNACHILSGTCLDCEQGVYGSYCNLSCPINCKDNICHMQTGSCFTCMPGWTGMYCKTSKNTTWKHFNNWSASLLSFTHFLNYDILLVGYLAKFDRISHKHKVLIVLYTSISEMLVQILFNRKKNVYVYLNFMFLYLRWLSLLLNCIDWIEWL